MSLPTLSLTEDQQFTALRAFLVAITPAGTNVVRGQQNLVPEPLADFIVMWPLRLERLGTNLTTFDDAVATASIAGSIMTVSALVSGTLVAGALLTDGTLGVLSGTMTIAQQTAGSTGGTGVYALNGTATFASGSVYAGVRYDLTQTRWVVQCDVHGPNSARNAQVIVSLFRSEVATDAFAAVGYSVVPLHADDARFMVFWNAEQSAEYRWVVDLHMEIVPIVGTPQQFMDQVEVTTVEADPPG